MKKFLSIMLSILMVVTMLPMAVMPASAVENLDYNIKLEVVDWAVYETSGKLIGEFNAVEHGDAFYDVSLTQADDGTFTCSYQIALERNDGNTAWNESSISFKIDSCKDEFLQEFEKSFYSSYNIFYNLKVTRSAGHSFSDWTDAGDGTHTRTCSVCSETETQNHSFEGGNCLTVGKCVCGLSSIDSNVHTKPVKYVVNSENNFKHDEVYECCGVIKSNLDHKFDSKGMCKECKYQCAHSSFTDSICDFCGYNSAFVVIDGTLGGKTTATEDDVNALVEQLKGYVDNGITTIIVTGSKPALIYIDYMDSYMPVVSEALYRLTDDGLYGDSLYCGSIDLILPDVTEILDNEFNNTKALNSITLPKVTTVGDGAFYATTFLQTLTFGAVITFVNEKNSGPFHMDGYKVGGCDLVLNCGQLQAEDKYKPNFETNVWFIGDWSGEYEWKSITLTHTGGEATCVAKAVCETCGEEYGDIDANAHSYSDVNSNGDGTHSFTCTACHITGIENHTGGTATCSKQAVCEVCGESYGELDPDNHASDTYTYTDNGDGTHDATYSCCGAAVAEVPHTLDVTTGKCSACGADMTAIATVTDSTNTYYASDAATLNQAVTAILETGSRTFTVELPADTEAEMITAIRRAICDTEGVADGSINLTLKGVTTIPGTTNWDGVAFGPRNAQWDENNVEIVSHEEVTQLASVNLPDATEIGAQAFYFCENLVTVSAPKAQTIGAQAFGYTALTSVEFPELTTIPTDMFSGTWTLSSAKFPKVTTIEQGGLLIGFGFRPENNPTPFPLELTAEGDITFNGSNHFNIASQNYSGKVDLVLNIDKKEQVTFNDDGTATWQVRDDLSYTFKSITFTCTDGTTNHSYTYTDNGDGTHDKVCLVCDYVEVDNEAHTGGTVTCTEQAKCKHCGASYGEVDADGHDWSNKDGICANCCGETCPHSSYTDGVCDKCDYECAHTWGEGVLTRPVYDAVLGSKDGYYTYTCTVCGEEKTETVKSSDYSAYEAVSEEINALLQSEELTPEAKQAIYSAANECGHLSDDLTESEQNIVDDLVAELQKIVADAEEKIASGEYVKADYTEIDEAIASVDEALENATISEEMKNELSDIKSQLEALKENENTSMADAAELLERVKAVAETMADCANGIHSFTKYEVTEEAECGKAGKEVASCDHGCGATDEKEIPALTHKDEDGDLKCDHGCGHEFEQPVEPEQPDTPDEPEQPEEDGTICEYCGSNHNNPIIRIFCRIIQFFIRLFTFLGFWE